MPATPRPGVAGAGLKQSGFACRARARARRVRGRTSGRARARFRRLTVEQRTVLVFHHYLGLPLDEVAVRIGIPVGTVKSRMHHAKRALRASLEAEARTAAASQERLA